MSGFIEGADHVVLTRWVACYCSPAVAFVWPHAHTVLRRFFSLALSHRIPRQLYISHIDPELSHDASDVRYFVPLSILLLSGLLS